MAAMDDGQGGVACGLKPVFEPDQAATGHFVQQVQDRFGHAVRTRADEKPHHALHPQGLLVKGSQALDRRVGVREGLKIGDEFFGVVAPGHGGFAGFQLGRDGKAAVMGAGA